MAPRMTKSKMYSYMRNVGRSFGYAMVDSVKSMNPTVTALFKTTAEQSRDLYQSVKNFDAKSLGFEDSDLKGTLGQAVKDLKNNALEDIRTGKWYNKDRMNRYETEMAEDMFGINFDDFGDFDDFNFEDTDLDEEASITEDATKATVKAMDEVGGKVSTAVSTAAIKSADYIVESNRINTKAIYGLTQAGFSQVNKGVATMNGNLQLLVSLAEPITIHIQNSALFYTKSQEYQNKSLEYLKQIAANTSPKSSNNFKTSGRGKSYTDFITSEGVIDIAALFENGAKRMKENTEMITSMLSFVPGGEKALLKMATASPLQFALTSAISAMFGMEDKQGNSIKKSFENFNKVLADFSLGLLGRAKKATFGDNIFSPFLRGIRDFLLPSDGNIQKKVNSGAYEKGKVDWDGISRRALTEVIPKQLGQILSILERNFGPAGNYRVYDYDKGQFKDTRRISAESRLAQRQITRSAGGDLFNDIRSSLKYSGMDTKTRRGYEKQIDSLLEYMMLSGNYDLLSSNFDFKKAGMSSSVAADLQKRIRAIQQTRGGQVKLSGLGGSVYSARNKFDARNRNASSVENSLVDNSIAGRQILNGSDKYGMTQSDYLVKILYHVSYISKNLKNLVATPGVGGFSNDGSQIHWEDGDKITQSNNKTSDLNTRPDRVAPMELGRNYNVNDAINRATGTKSSPYTDAEEKVLAKYGGDPEKIPDDEPLKDAILRKFNFEQMKGAASSFASGAYDRLRGGKFGKVIGGVENYLGTSTEEVTAALDKVSGALNDFVYDNKTGIYALMNTMTAGVLDMIKGLIPKEVRDLISAGWKKLKESKFGKATGETLRNIAFSFFGKKKENKVYDAPDAGIDFVPVDDEDYFEVPGAHGSGLIRRINSATSRIYSNQRAGGNFWGNYSRLVSSSPRTGYAGGRSRSRRRSYRTRKFSGGATGTTDEAAAEPPEEEVSDEAVESLFHRIASKVSSSIINKISDVIGKNDPEKEKKDVKGTIEKLMKEAGLAKGAIGAGAVIGGGASLLTGAFLGPIAGAAIGAAAGFVAKSETAQKFLFGEWDEEKGEYTGNSLLPKEVGKFFKQNGAATGKGAGAGMLIGTFMGSPVLGAILGASAGYISSSEKAKKFIFGDMENEEEGLIPLSLQKTLKEKFPFFAGGIGAALLFAPGPLIPKIAIGATIGAIVGNDKGEGLKNWFFGEKGEDGKRSGGFLGYMNEQLFKPILGTIDKAFNILTKGLKDKLTQMVRGFGNLLKNVLSKTHIGQGVLNVGNKLASLGGSVAKGIVNVVGSPFRAANRALERKALRQGYAYRGENNEYLTSAQRLERYKDKDGNGEFTYRETGSSLIDQYLASQNNMTPEEYEAILSDLQSAERGEDVSENATIQNILKLSKHGMGKLDYKSITHGIQQAKIDKQHRDKLTAEQKEKEGTVEFNVTEKIPSLVERVANKLDDIFAYLSGNIGEVKGDGESTGPQELDQTREDSVRDENGNFNVASIAGRNAQRDKETEREANETITRIDDEQQETTDAVNNLADRLLGNEDEKKPGLFDKIKDALLGEGGLLGGLLGFFTGGIGTKGIVGKLLSKFSLKNALPWLARGLGIAALATAWKGGFDEIAAKIDNNYSSRQTGDNTYVDNNGNVVEKQEDGTYINPETGEIVDPRNVSVQNNESNMSFGKTFRSKTIRNALTGRHSLLTVGLKGVFKGTKIGAAAKTVAGALTGNVTAKTNLLTFASKQLEKLPGFLKNLPYIGSKIDGDSLAIKIYSALDDVLKDGSKLTKGLAIMKKAAVVLTVLFFIADFTSGMQDAETIYGVKKASFAESVIAGLIKAVTNLIPLVDLIPKATLIDIFIDHVAPALGIDVSDLKARREEANDELAKINAQIAENGYWIDDNGEKHATDQEFENWADYQKRGLGNYIWTEQVGNGVKSVTNRLIDNAKSGATSGAANKMAYDHNDKVQKAIDEWNTQYGQNNTMEDYQSNAKFKLEIDNRVEESAAKEKVYTHNKKFGTSYSIEQYYNDRDIKRLIDDGAKATLETSYLTDTNITAANTTYSTTSAANRKMTAEEAIEEYIKRHGIGNPDDPYSIMKYNLGTDYQFNKEVDEIMAGGSSGVISQFDRKYNNYKVGGKSFAANGCGPASAVMATGGDLGSAVRIAQKYQTTGGTDAAYFGEMFNRRGMKAHYYLAGGSSLIGDIASGKPTVLMGRDIYNTSKANSPFGPNNHYVVANGFDGAGNLLISDPEQRGIRRYSPSILRNVKVGVSGGASYADQYDPDNPATWNTQDNYVTSSTTTSSNWRDYVDSSSAPTTGVDYANDSKYTAPTSDWKYLSSGVWINSKTGETRTNAPDTSTHLWGQNGSTGGTDNQDSTGGTSIGTGAKSDNISQIWGYLKNKGFNDYASAGIMGCWQCESNNNPDTLEGNYALKEDPNKIMASNSLMNEYTRKVWQLHKVGEKGQKGYYADDGNLYPGYGLAQWTGPRQKAFIDWSKNQGADHRSLLTQLNYFWSEFEKRPKYQQSAANASSIEEGTIAALDDFEMHSGWHNESITGKKQYNDRLTAAKSIYAQMNGLPGTYPDGSNGIDIGDGTDSEASNAANSAKKKGKLTIGGVLSTVVSAFSNAFSKLFNGSEEEEEGEGGTSITTGTDGTSTIFGTDPVSYMQAIKNKVKYTFGAKNPEAGQADCSGTVNWAVKKASGIDIGGSTLAMYTNTKNLKPVWYENGQTAGSLPSVAKRNDIFLFSRPNSDFTKGRPDRVGHVGIYTGEGNKFIHIGSGVGPYETELKSGSNLIKVSRLIDDNGNEIQFDGNGEVGDIGGNELSYDAYDTTKDYGSAKAQAKSEQTAAKSAKNATLRGEAARGSGLLHYGPSRAGNYILRDNSRNYYRQGGGASGTVSTPVSGGSLLDMAKGAVTKAATSAKQSARDLGNIPANVSAIKQDTNSMDTTLKAIATELIEIKNQLNGSNAKATTSGSQSTTSGDFASNKELKDIMDSIITSAV